MYLSVFFPSGRYYAADAHDPSFPEWPPHPSRLFSAIVASAYRSGSGMTELKRRTIEWLESLPPPSIAAPDVELSPAPTCYVPPGDSVGPKGKKGQEKYEHGVHRWGKPRHFPNATIMGDPVIYYDWQEDLDVDLLTALEEITEGITHVGTSHSIALVNPYSGEMTQAPTLLPDPQGTRFLRIPAPGRLQELDGVFDQTAGVRRPAPACEPLASYRQAKDQTIQEQAFEFIALRISDSAHGADTSAYLGRAVRRAVMSVLGDDAPPVVHGHNHEKHIGWLPLPDVGHRHASGRIVGIGIMLPQELDMKERKKILAGLNEVREVRLLDGRVAQLSAPTPGERLPVVLSQQTWTRPCRTWATVTPVVLDRPPKKLTDKRVRSALVESMVFAGYPEPQDIQVSTFSFFRGAPPAFRVPAEKPRYHAVVRFKEPVKGPVIAGRLRYFGIGFFRPLPSDIYFGDLNNDV